MNDDGLLLAGVFIAWIIGGAIIAAILTWVEHRDGDDWPGGH